MTALYVIIAILIFGVLIAVHELGHFALAKLCGVRVDEFALGMGPVIFQKQRGETMYSLRCLPIGGFCAMAGEDEESDDPRAFNNRPAWKKVLILIAGSFNNFLLGVLVVIILYSGAGAFRAPVIEAFMEGCPYEGEGMLLAGDRFYKIDGHRVLEYSDVADFLDNGEDVHDIIVIRNGAKHSINGFEFKRVEFEGYENKMYGFYMGYEEATFGNVLRYSWNTSMQFGRMVWMGLSQLFSGEVGVQDMSGPVGIVDIMAETGQSAPTFADAVYRICFLGAFIAINLAIMNMLPIPALDGGRIFALMITLIIEALTHKKLDPKYEGYIHAAGMVLLLGFMAFVMLNDIIRIVTG